MNHTARELGKQLLRITVGLILVDRIIHILLGQLILQFKGNYGQAVDEHTQVERQLGLVRGKVQLTGDAEDVFRMQRCGGGVIYAGRHIEHD